MKAEDLKKISAAAQAVQQAEEQSIAATNQASQDYIAGYNDRTQDLQSRLQQSNEAVNNAALSYSNMIAGWENAIKQHQDKLQKEAEEKNKQEQKAIKLGGLAGAANAIANLIGTVKGAANQEQTDFVSKWQARADAARKERESKLGSYRKQLKNLEAQRALLQYNFAKEKASANSNLAALITQRNDNEGQIRAKSANDNAAGKAKLAANNYARAVQSFNSALQRDKAANDAYNEGVQTQIRAKEAEARIQTERSKQLANGYDALTGKFYNPETKKYDSDSFIGTPPKSSTSSKKSISNYTADDWRGFRDKYAERNGLKGGYQTYINLKKKGGENYKKWVESHPEESQVLEWISSPLDLDKGDLDKLTIIQSVADTINDEPIREREGVDPNTVQGARQDETKQFVGMAGVIQRGNPIKGVIYDKNGNVELP